MAVVPPRHSLTSPRLGLAALHLSLSVLILLACSLRGAVPEGLLLIGLTLWRAGCALAPGHFGLRQWPRMRSAKRLLLTAVLACLLFGGWASLHALAP